MYKIDKRSLNGQKDVLIFRILLRSLTLAHRRKLIDLRCFQDVGRWKLEAISDQIGE